MRKQRHCEFCKSDGHRTHHCKQIFCKICFQMGHTSKQCRAQWNSERIISYAQLIGQPIDNPETLRCAICNGCHGTLYHKRHVNKKVCPQCQISLDNHKPGRCCPCKICNSYEHFEGHHAKCYYCGFEGHRGKYCPIRSQ